MTSSLSRGGNQDSDRVSDVPGITQAKVRVQIQASLMPEPLTAAPAFRCPSRWCREGLGLEEASASGLGAVPSSDLASVLAA